MMPLQDPAELALLPLAAQAAQPARELRPVPDREPHDVDPRDRAPKRMTKRCRRCGKPVPTDGALVWRARRVALDTELAAGDVFHVRAEPEADGQREALLKRAHERQHDAAESARLLLADLRRLQAHDRRCRPGESRQA